MKFCILASEVTRIVDEATKVLGLSLFVPVKMRSKCRKVVFELLHELSHESSREQRTKFTHFACITFAQYCSLQSKQNTGLSEQQGYLFQMNEVIPQKTSQQAHTRLVY